MGAITQQVNRYTYRAEWDPEFGQSICRCLELPWLSQCAPTMQDAMLAVEEAVDEYVAENRGRLPQPLTDHKFSGRFVVRTSPMLHARLTVEAAEQNVSMNQWVVQKLAGRAPIGLLDL
jgi:hypothetical protein